MKFREGWQWSNEQKKLVAIRITVWIQGLFSGFITIGIEKGKVIRQMAAVVRRALVEVCTAPVLLLSICF